MILRRIPVAVSQNVDLFCFPKARNAFFSRDHTVVPSHQAEYFCYTRPENSSIFNTFMIIATVYISVNAIKNKLSKNYCQFLLPGSVDTPIKEPYNGNEIIIF